MLAELKSTGGKYLLALSGGIDSMAMATMFINAGIDAGVAHCNFGLRGQESDDDETFVSHFAQSHNLPFHLARFNTSEYAAANGLSVQQAARTLRYEWFETLLHKHSYRKIAIAHNADDQLETFFINLMRGAGLAGLTGIVAETGYTVRPLINISRKQIEEYVLEHRVTFREDSSNKSHKYLRNRLRHIVLPELDGISPAFRSKAGESLKYLKQANNFIASIIDEMANNISTRRGQDTIIPISMLRRYAGSLDFVLFQLLEPYGFKRDAIVEILRSLNSESGRQFTSDEYLLVKDRDELIISPLNSLIASESIIDEASLPATFGGMLCEIFNRNPAFRPRSSPAIGQLDADKLHFPLILRTVKHGDRFVPFGMKGSKKLSDFLIDNKLSIADKMKQLVLVSGENIAWVAGRRIDERYRITDRTTRIFRITQQPRGNSSEQT